MASDTGGDEARVCPPSSSNKQETDPFSVAKSCFLISLKYREPEAAVGLQGGGRVLGQEVKLRSFLPFLLNAEVVCHTLESNMKGVVIHNAIGNRRPSQRQCLQETATSEARPEKMSTVNYVIALHPRCFI